MAYRVNGCAKTEERPIEQRRFTEPCMPYSEEDLPCYNTIKPEGKGGQYDLKLRDIALAVEHTQCPT